MIELETLEPHLQRMVDHGVNGLDIMHGELKNLMLVAEAQLEEATESHNCKIPTPWSW